MHELFALAFPKRQCADSFLFRSVRVLYLFASIRTQHLFTHPYPADSLRERILTGHIYLPVKEGDPFLGPSSPVREDFRNAVKKTPQGWTNKVYAHRGRRRGDFRIPRGESYKRRCDRYTTTHRHRAALPLALQTAAVGIHRMS